MKVLFPHPAGFRGKSEEERGSGEAGSPTVPGWCSVVHVGNGGTKIGDKDGFEGNLFAFGLSGSNSSQPRGSLSLPLTPELRLELGPPLCPSYLGEPVFLSEVRPDRGSLRLALGELGISLHPAEHTGHSPTARAPHPWL